MNSRVSGSIAESKVVTRLIECGAVVSEPLHFEARYDLLADFGDDIYRVQVKRAFASDKDNSISVEARSRNHCGSNPYDGTEVDSIAVYSPELEDIHWYWIDEVPDQFNIYIGTWDNLRPSNKASVRNPKEYQIANRKI